MNFKWDLEKNKLLKKERGVCFEDVLTEIHEDRVLDIIKHPKKEKYPLQRIYIIILQNYVHMVPFVIDGEDIFLKTIVPSRKMNRIYQGDGHEN